MSKLHKRRNLASVPPLTPDYAKHQRCTGCAQLEQLLNAKERQLVMQSRVLHTVTGLLKTSSALGGLRPSETK